MACLRLFALALCLPALAACWAVAGAAVGAAVAIGAYKYAENRLSRDYGAPLDRVYDAALGAAAALDVRVDDRQKGLADASIDGKMGNGEGVKIRLEKKEENRTEVRVSVGTFESDAHRAAAESVHEEIRRRLESASP
jgi:hypothetical protein